jgi:hypothetical protein
MQTRAVLRPVKAFGNDGKNEILYRKRFTVADAEYMVRERKVVARRNRHGAIVAIYFCEDCPIPFRARSKAGTRYSHRDGVGETRPWAHSRLPRVKSIDLPTRSHAEFVQAHDYIQSKPFRAVLNSILATA